MPAQYSSAHSIAPSSSRCTSHAAHWLKSPRSGLRTMSSQVGTTTSSGPIVTRPSTESFSGNTNFAYQDDAFNARNALAVEETPEGNKQVQFQFRGPILRGKSAFTATVSGNNRYTSNNNLAVDQYGNRIGTQVRVPTDQRNANLGIEHALTKNSTLRLNYQRQASEGRNQGLGNFDLIERARETESSGNMLRAQI